MNNSVYNLYEYDINLEDIKKLYSSDITIDRILKIDDAFVKLFAFTNSNLVYEINNAAKKYEIRKREGYISPYTLYPTGLSLEYCKIMFENQVNLSNLENKTKNEIIMTTGLSREIIDNNLEIFEPFIRMEKENDSHGCFIEEKIRIYGLVNFGVSLKYIEMLLENCITDKDIIDDFSKNKNILKNIGEVKRQEIKKAMIYYNNVYGNNYISPFALLMYKLPIIHAKLLFENNMDIRKLFDKKINFFISEFDLKPIIAERIYNSINDLKKEIYNSDEYINIEKTIVSFLHDDTKSIIAIKNFISNSFQISFEELQDVMKAMVEKGIARFESRGLALVDARSNDDEVLTVFEKIDKTIDNEHKDIITLKIKGETLDSIAKLKGITRERVRQIINKNIDKIGAVKEDEFAKYFKKYSWKKNEFCLFFNVEVFVFNYLSMVYKLGKISTLDILYNGMNNFDQITYNKNEHIILKNHGYAKIFGNIVKVSSVNVLIELLKKYAMDFKHLDEIIEIYNDYIIENSYLNLSPIDRSMENILDRSKCAILSQGKQYRYYEIDNLSNKDLEHLKNLLDVDSGWYSANFFYKENQLFMSEIDIRNEYELHNLLRKKFDKEIDGLTFSKMPMILINCENRETFIREKINEYGTIDLEDFLKIIEEDYGHKIETLQSWVKKDFMDMIKDGKIGSKVQILELEEILRLKDNLVVPVYKREDAFDIFTKKCGISSAKFNDFNLQQIGYRMRPNYILSLEYSTVEGYINSLIENKEFFNRDNPIFKLSAFNNILKQKEKNFEIVRFSSTEYIKISKLETAGIYRETLLEMREVLSEYLLQTSYMSIKNLEETSIGNLLEDYDSEGYFLETIIETIENVRLLKINNQRLYTVNIDNPSIYSFIEYIIDKYGTLTIYDLCDKVDEIYDIKIDYSFIRGHISKADVYYEDGNTTIYRTKEDYLEEIYG